MRQLSGIQKMEADETIWVMSMSRAYLGLDMPDEEEYKSGTVVWTPEQGNYVRTEKKVGRNDPCPCGSGEKYKYCCGK